MAEQWRRRRRRRWPWTSTSCNEDSDGRLHIFLAELAAVLGATSYGLSVGYSSPALPDMRQRMPLTESQSSWFGSLLNIGALVGGLLGGQSIRYLGRRYTLLLSAVFHIAGWILIATGTAVWMLLLGRTLTGLATGVVALTVPVFVSEVSPKEIRGFLDTVCTMAITFGILMAYVMGKWLHYDVLAAASIIPAVAMTIVLPMLAGSPRWLLQVGRHDSALRALQFYRGPDVAVEFGAMHEAVTADAESPLTLAELARPWVYKPFLCTLCAFFLQQFSGIVVMLFYTHDIFATAGTGLSAADSTIVVGAVQVVCVGLATQLTDRLGRRPLMLISLAVSGVSLVVLGCFYHYKRTLGPSFVHSYGWLPLFSLCLYFLGFSVGLSPLPSILMGEMLPLRLKAVATSFLISFYFLCGTLIAKEYNDMLVLVGEDGVYWFYAGFMAVGFVLTAAFLPETKGKTLEEIEEIFGSHRYQLEESDD
ncbi:facilitated trehalose transporter Tret1-like isoform X2 [Dermacentor albipictus]